MSAESSFTVRRRFIIQGTVQGVGFRPFIYRLAQRWELGGFVSNDNRGVITEVEGTPVAVARFERALREEAPPLARIDTMIAEELPPRGETTFAIAPTSSDVGGTVLIPPDVAMCDDCLYEILDTSDRRYRYSFTNCTNCGPRFTIIEDVPYDRDKTTMQDFPMCEACQAEYNNSLSRRFFAQPISCPICGPQIRLLDALGRVLDVDDPIEEAARRLAEGAVLAIKGLGGYLLACDATDRAALQRLQRYKYHEGWLFPLMVPDLTVARRLCEVVDTTGEALQSRQRPIVLLRRLEECPLPPDLTPSYSTHSTHSTLGLLLPYTPLHELLLRAYAMAVEPERPAVLVMSRSSIAGEPIIYQDDAALSQLLPVIDAMLTHNRAISVHCDDSVVRIVHGAAQLLRRERGYVPQPIRLPVASPIPLLACGTDHETTLCFAQGHQAFPSQHLGDITRPEIIESLRDDVAHFQHLFGRPEALVYDLASQVSPSAVVFDTSIPRKIGVAHQHAHIASVLAEHGIDQAAIGIVADSPTRGIDNTLWGCEVMIADLLEFERQAHLVQVQVPTESDARRQPWQMAVAYLKYVYGNDFLKLDIPMVQELTQRYPEGLTDLFATSASTTASSSLTCLFDAVAALIGLGHNVSRDDMFEGWGVVQLEVAAQAGLRSYPVPVSMRMVEALEISPVIHAIVGDLKRGVQVASIAGRFHSTIAAMLARSARQIGKIFGLDTVALSGDMFHNQLLLEDLMRRLESFSFKVLINRQVPPNDRGVSLGQAAVAAARLQHHPDEVFAPK